MPSEANRNRRSLPVSRYARRLEQGLCIHACSRQAFQIPLEEAGKNQENFACYRRGVGADVELTQLPRCH